jgi:hypothetical protein
VEKAAPAVTLDDGSVFITNWLAVPGLIVVMVAVPVFPDPVTTNVRLLPETVGVTLTPESTPAEKAVDVPVTPAVPL